MARRSLYCAIMTETKNFSCLKAALVAVCGTGAKLLKNNGCQTNMLRCHFF